MDDIYYKKLDAYKLAKKLTIYVYDQIRKFPEYEKFALADQLRRAAISVPSNIAEGMGRMSIKERVHFLDFSYGSLAETDCQLDIACTLGYISEQDYVTFQQLAERTGHTILGLKKSLENKINN